MKKVLYIFPILFLMVTIKYFVADYTISYDIDDYKIKEKVNGNTTYIEVIYQDNVYSYLINKGRSIFKKIISNIDKEEVNGNICLTPNNLYTVCKENDYLINKDVFSYNHVNEDFQYNSDSLSNKEYLVIWKYNGFYYMNGDSYKYINIIDKDRYSNDLMISIDNYIVFPLYNEEYTFNSIVIFNIKSGKYNIIESKYNISYDAYYVGVYKYNLYLFDNKNKELYVINYKKESVKKAVIGNDSYYKYKSGKKVKSSINEYISKSVNFLNKEEDTVIVSKNILSYKYNLDIKYKYFDSEDINVIKVVNNKVYFIYKDNVYSFYKGKVSYITHYFEFNFNKDNKVFIYSE